ncbi:hypothetical protein POM88_033540 [Heracleum sosnowskyi]|uniref:F-box domain-containing protein n=1 Tax=Heracleum sosnowskyi TaxID=360622 RepID=A0AAD8I1C6_9APIA|nr:hypothetical protein POM88_033540 [Heracleum sosnowskyi]
MKLVKSIPMFDSGTLPADVMELVFLHSSFKSLVRHRCVAKSWIKFLSSPYFSLRRKKFRQVLRQEDDLLICPGSIKCRNSLLLIHVPNPLVLNSSFTFPNSCRDMFVVGSYNGVICLSDPPFRGFKFVGFWNPLINLFTRISVPDIFNPEIDLNNSVGLAYDSDLEKFNIVILSPQPLSSTDSRVLVYYGKNNLWEELNPIPFIPRNQFPSSK